MLYLCSHYEQILRSICRYKFLCTYILLLTHEENIQSICFILWCKKAFVRVSGQDTRNQKPFLVFQTERIQGKELFTNVLKRLRERTRGDVITQRLVTAGNHCSPYSGRSKGESDTWTLQALLWWRCWCCFWRHLAAALWAHSCRCWWTCSSSGWCLQLLAAGTTVLLLQRPAVVWRCCHHYHNLWVLRATDWIGFLCCLLQWNLQSRMENTH